MKINSRILGIVLIVIGGVVCLFHLGVKAKNMIFMAGAEETTGYVVDVEGRTTYTERKGNRNSTTKYTISVEYSVNEQVYTTVFNSGTYGVSEGKQVTVYYKKKNPEKAVADIEMKTKIDFMYPLMLGLGMLFFFADKKEEE